MIKKVAKYISEFFVEKNVTDCFMVTGGGAMHLDDAIGHEKAINVTYNHHEQASAIAAEGYTRMSGKIALVCVTSGPGGTNAITGVMGGWVDSIPMFVLTGQVKRETTINCVSDLNLRQLGDQEFDIIPSVKNMTKYAIQIRDPRDIAYHLEKAWYFATTGRPGPVWIDIPLDVQGANIETGDLRHFDAKNEGYWDEKHASQATLEILIEKIKTSKAPLILAGTGIRLGNAEKEFLEFVEKYKIPVITAWNANDTLAYDSPYFSGMPGTVGTRAGNFALQNADLLISLGCRMNLRLIGYTHYDFAKNAFKCAVDIDRRELMKPTIQIDLPIHDDVKSFLIRMNEMNYEPMDIHDAWRKWCRNNVEKYPSTRLISKELNDNSKKIYDKNQDGEMINPYYFMDSLFNELTPDDQIVTGNGAACVVTFQAAKIKQGQRLFTNSGCAAMGYGLPAAMGASISNKDKRTICIDGDGSIMMNLQELATIAYNQLNMKIIILNNNGYLSIRQTQRNLFKPPFIGIDNESGVGFPDFGILAQAFGIAYEKIENCGSYRENLKNALKQEGTVIIEVVVDPEQNFEPKSSSRVLADGSMVSPTLSDMAPFLPRDEYNKSCKYEITE